MTHKLPCLRQLRWTTLCLMVGSAGLFAGCSNMSGLGGSSEMSCAAPPGVPCMSVSGVHANASAGTLPSQRGAAAGGTVAPVRKDAPALDQAGEQLSRLTPLIPAGEEGPSLGAIRSEPTLIRIWIAPWEDADGDLHSDSYVYLQVDSGRWLIEHNRERVRRQFAPIPATAASPAVPVAGASGVPSATAGGPGPAKPGLQVPTSQRTAAQPSAGVAR